MEVLLEQTVVNSRLGVDDLADLMKSFNEVTDRLQATHVALRKQVASLEAELTSANAQLRRSRQLAALGEMAAGIAHEIRNPLGSIQLYAQVLAEDVGDKPQAVGLCEKIQMAIQCLDSIVCDVLSFARDTRLQRVKVRSTDIIDRALLSCESLLIQHDVHVRYVKPKHAELVEADVGLLAQALANIIRNGVEAMASYDLSSHAQNTLWLDISRSAVRCPDGKRRDRLVFSVRDAGPGIAPDVIERMFNPFFTTRKTGTGLGLAIVNRIVEAHGGHVAVRNYERGGALVELCLPVIVVMDAEVQSTHSDGALCAIQRMETPEQTELIV